MAAGGEAVVPVPVLQDHPDLQPFLLPAVRLTGRRLCSTVEEVEIPGATCAARKIPGVFEEGSEVEAAAVREFVKECKLLSALRHPRIVQFIGVCFFPRLTLPALVNERLFVSLHELLDPGTEAHFFSTHDRNIPLGLKRCILLDVAQGLAFLHGHTPAIVHRQLTARSVLLTTDMVAKISEVGLSRIAPTTGASEAFVYLPLEALNEKSRNDTNIDVFSFGVLAIFILSQTFPKPLSSLYQGTKSEWKSRSELERRANYMQKIYNTIRRSHILVKIIECCLSNNPSKRPHVTQVVELLKNAKKEVSDGESDLSRLQLVQAVRQNSQVIRNQAEQIRSLQSSLEASEKQAQVRLEQIHAQQAVLLVKENEITQLQQQLGITHSSLMQQQEDPISTAKMEEAVPWRMRMRNTQEEVIRHIKMEEQRPKVPFTIRWRRVSDFDYGIFQPQAVTIGHVVYVGGGETDGLNNEYVVLKYSQEDVNWEKLPESPLCNFAMASLDGQLVLAGGSGDDSRVAVLSKDETEWTFPFPPMPTGRPWAVAVGFQNHLIVACGSLGFSTVEILDVGTKRWYTACPLPVGGHRMTSALIGDRWYLTSPLWEDDLVHIFFIHLPTLIANAKLTDNDRPPLVWSSLPSPPLDGGSLTAAYNHLILIGAGGKRPLYYFDWDSSEWKETGKLGSDVPAFWPTCTMMPDREMLLVGGRPRNDYSMSTRVFLGTLYFDF